MLAYSAAMLVVHDAGRLIEHLPPALPGEKSQVRVFQIKRREQRIEPPELEELPAIESARSAAAVEAGEEAVDYGGSSVCLTHSTPSRHKPWVKPVSFTTFGRGRRGRSGRKRQKPYRLRLRHRR